jgi:hypothetical protein
MVVGGGLTAKAFAKGLTFARAAPAANMASRRLANRVAAKAQIRRRSGRFIVSFMGFSYRVRAIERRSS